VLVAARRLRELNRGDAKRVLSRHNNSVVVLEEIEQGKVTRDYLFKEPDQEPRRRSRGK
jgi:DNA-directed RNA polymerase subunit K/omega